MGELPHSVQEVAEVIGRERALYLAGQLPRCGSRAWRRFISIPRPARLKSDHRLVQVLGWDDAQALCEVFQGENIELATCTEMIRSWRDLNVRRLAQQGNSSAELARIFGLSQRQIRNILSI